MQTVEHVPDKCLVFRITVNIYTTHLNIFAFR